MKRLLLITRILLFISFLMPFFFFERCEPSKKEKEAGIEKAKQDSINAAVEAHRHADSIATFTSQKIINDSIKIANRKLKQDSLKVSELKNNVDINKTNRSKEKKEAKLIVKIWDHMLFPTDHSISALGVSIITVELEINFFNYKKIKLENFLSLLIPFIYLISLILLLLIILKKIKISRIFSMISMLFFIVGIFLYHKEGILWGYWVAFILNMIDLVLVNLILEKAKPG